MSSTSTDALSTFNSRECVFLFLKAVRNNASHSTSIIQLRVDNLTRGSVIFMHQQHHDLPQKPCLDANDIATYLGISKSLAYALLHRSDFPHIVINEKRLVCPREYFIEWVDQQIKGNMTKGGE